MKRVVVIGFLALLCFDTAAQLCFKLASNDAMPLDFSVGWLIRLFTKPWVYGAVLGYLATFVTWMTILKHAPVGPSFAASHMELVTVTLLSVWLLHEPLNAYKVVGGALILLGVFCLAKGESEAGKAEAKPENDGTNAPLSSGAQGACSACATPGACDVSDVSGASATSGVCATLGASAASAASDNTAGPSGA